MTMTSTTRVCFELQVRPELVDEYVARHSPVPQTMLAEIAAADQGAPALTEIFHLADQRAAASDSPYEH